MSTYVFHQEERYRTTKSVIDVLRNEQSCYSLLEVGAGKHGNLAAFFPKDQILFTDVIYTKEDLEDPRFCIADVTKLEMEDNSFDFVIALDVLEHIPPELRGKAISETIRVAREGVFFSFPHLVKGRSLEDELNDIYLAFQREPPIWLHEHKEYGLPNCSDIYDVAMQILPAEQIYFAHGVNTALNRTMQRMEAYASCNPELTERFLQMNNRYTETYLNKDYGDEENASVKSYMLLTKRPISSDKRKGLNALFQQNCREELLLFRDWVKKGLKEELILINKRKWETNLDNMQMTAILEIVDRMDQVLESEKNIGDIGHQLIDNLEQQNVEKQQLIAQLKERLSAQEELEGRLAQQFEQNHLSLKQIMDQMKTQAECGMRIAKQLEQWGNELKKVSMNVILITYNQEKYIRKALSSILNQQTNFRFNIIVADDCSQDQTLDIIREMEKGTDVPFVYLDHTYNRGIMKNYRRAFAACDAEYVAIMEGDDIWTDPYRLQAHRNFLSEHIECAMSFNCYEVRDFEKNQAHIQPVFGAAPQETYSIIKGNDLAYDNLIGNFSTCVYKNAYLRLLPDELYHVNAYDWLTNLLISRMGNVGCLLKPMNIYRVHSGGTWSTKKQEDKIQEIIDIIPVYDEMTDYAYSAGFAAHRARLEQHLHAILGSYQKAEERVEDRDECKEADSCEIESQSIDQPIVKKRTVRQRVKGALIRARDGLICLADYLPPILVGILKYLIPPRISQRMMNMRQE